MQINVQEAHQLVVRIMSAIGHDAADAGLIADHLIDCELRGLSYGGLARAISIAERMARIGGSVTRAVPLPSQALANDLEKQFPEDTSVVFTYLPTLRALFALKRGEPANAIEQLRVASPYELGIPGIDFNFFFGGLYPAYVRGESYLAAHQGTEAAAVSMLMDGASEFPEPPPPPFEMIVNRPFVFAICDDFTGVVVFLGVVSERHFKLDGCRHISHFSVGY